MVLQPDQQRVCTMLKDTITLLCKNGLVFKSKFSIEAVIGVTLDDKDMFHVSMNQVVESPAAPSEAGDGESKSSSSETFETNGHKQKRRKRRHMKRETGNSDISSDEEVSDQNSLDALRSPNHENSTCNTTEHLPVTKVESGFGADVEEQDDIVFVKEEIDDSWSFSQAGQPKVSISQDCAQNQGYFQTSNRNATSQNNSGWHLNQSTSSRTMIVPESSQSSARMDQSSTRKYSCNVCRKSLSTPVYLKRHMDKHRGIYPYPCTLCHKGYNNKQDLEGHMSIHTGVLPFQCEYCGKKVRWKASLVFHKSSCPARPRD